MHAFCRRIQIRPPLRVAIELLAPLVSSPASRGSHRLIMDHGQCYWHPVGAGEVVWHMRVPTTRIWPNGGETCCVINPFSQCATTIVDGRCDLGRGAGVLILPTPTKYLACRHFVWLNIPPPLPCPCYIMRLLRGPSRAHIIIRYPCSSSVSALTFNARSWLITPAYQRTSCGPSLARLA